MFHTILVPLDGTEFSKQALPTAMAIARRTGARVRLACVHAEMTPVEALLGMSPDAARYERERATLERLAAEMTAGGVPTDSSVLDGSAAQALADHADAVGAGLVVMTTHGRRPIARAFLGSVSEQLVRLLKVPTLLVRPAELDGVAPRPSHTRNLLIALDGSPAAEAMLLTAAELGEVLECRSATPRSFLTPRVRGVRSTLSRSWSACSRTARQGLRFRLPSSWRQFSSRGASMWRRRSF